MHPTNACNSLVFLHCRKDGEDARTLNAVLLVTLMHTYELNWKFCSLCEFINFNLCLCITCFLRSKTKQFNGWTRYQRHSAWLLSIFNGFTCLHFIRNWDAFQMHGIFNGKNIALSINHFLVIGQFNSTKHQIE